MQPVAEAHRQLKHAIICSQHQNVARGIEDGRADLAVLQMLLDLLFRLRRQRIIQIIGDVVPNMFAF
jgi:hypothetical protein